MSSSFQKAVQQSDDNDTLCQNEKAVEIPFFPQEIVAGEAPHALTEYKNTGTERNITQIMKTLFYGVGGGGGGGRQLKIVTTKFPYFD